MGPVAGYAGCMATPCSLSLPRNADIEVTVEKAGFSAIRYRVISAVTVSNDVLPPGTLIAGLPPGSHVVVGKPDGGQIGLRGASLAAGLFSLGASPVVDAATNANRNLTPKDVTVFLAPDGQHDENEGPDGLGTDG